MFEARLAQSTTLKKVLDSIREIVGQTNFDCSADGLSLQVSCEFPICYNEMHPVQSEESNQHTSFFYTISV